MNGTDNTDTRAMPNGTERPGEHWNARLIREEAERKAALSAVRSDGKPSTERTPTGLEHALAEILTAVNDNDPVGAYDDYDDCSADELHIHKQLNRIRDRITVIRAENDLPMDGAVTAEQSKPDYWMTLADAIRQHADRIATLAGTDWKPTHAYLSIMMSNPGNKNPIAGDKVDVVADVFGLTAKTVKSPGGYYERKAGGKLNGLNFSVYGYVPAPSEMDDPEKAALRAELEMLRAQLADGGGPAAMPANPDRKCRYCAATSGLKMVRGDVLELTPMQWQCWDDCKDSAR